MEPLADRNRDGSFVGRLALIWAVLTGAALLLACSSTSSHSISTAPAGTSVTAQASPLPPENSPAGDIPDSQAFVAYHSATGGYTLQVPEGWARTELDANVRFADKFDSIAVEVTPAAATPTLDSVASTDVPELQQRVAAFELIEVTSVDLPGGHAIRIRYRSNSAADEVTGKQVRLETDRYELFNSGKEAALSLSAPAGSDNVDVWKHISESFAWG